LDITIREYKNDDYNACRSLYGELTQYHADIYEDDSIAGDDSGRGFDEYLGRNDLCGVWVAISEQKIIGLAGLLDVVGEEGLAEIEPVVVSTSSRGEGVGTKLIEHVIGEAKKRKFQFLSIRPELRNEGAFDLYVRLGFNKVSTVELFRELSPVSDRKWKSVIEIRGHKLNY